MTYGKIFVKATSKGRATFCHILFVVSGSQSVVKKKLEDE